MTEEITKKRKSSIWFKIITIVVCLLIFCLIMAIIDFLTLSPKDLIM